MSAPTRFKPYPAYKGSGVEWLGEIPTHWEVKRVKHVATKIGSGKTPSGGAEVYVSEGVMLLRSQNVHFGGLVLDDVAHIDLVTDARMAGSRVHDGDVLLNITGASLGRCCVARLDDKRANVNQHVCVIRPSVGMYEPEFLAAAIASRSVQAQIFTTENGISRDALNFEQIGELAVARPPLKEQHAIVSFFEHHAARIDALVAKKERLVKLLQEKRTALITRAVTKGLDPTVPMKDSGVEWLGEIPAHWEVMRLRHVARSLGVGVVVNPSQYVTDEGLPFLYGSDVTEGHLSARDCRHISPDDSRRLPKSQLRPGDLVMVRVGAPGVTAVVPPELDGANCASILVIRKAIGIISTWLCYTLNSWSVRTQVRIVQYGAAQEQFNVSHAVNFLVPVPSSEDQHAIAAFLDHETARIDALITKIREAIERLKEYRTALISAAVTGKIDVRHTT